MNLKPTDKGSPKTSIGYFDDNLILVNYSNSASLIEYIIKILNHIRKGSILLSDLN